jgi:hypothetical protein
LIRVKGTNLSLKKGHLAKGATAGSGLDAPGKGDSFPETDGISFFVMNTKGRAGLFGK